MLFRLLSHPLVHSVLFVAGFWIVLDFALDFALEYYALIAVDSRPPSSSSASASKPSTSSATSPPATDSAARRSCSKCSRRMSSYANDKHSLCLHCRDVLCSVDIRCKECKDWSTESMLEYLKHRKSLVSKGRKRLSVATPTSAPPSVTFYGFARVHFFFFFFFLLFFPPRFCTHHISGTVTLRDSKLSVLLGPLV